MTGYSVTCKTTKIAWRRDPSVPAGQPALGSFNCPCGHTITGVSFGSEQDNPCQCGRVWDGRGWLVSEPPEQIRLNGCTCTPVRGSHRPPCAWAMR